MISNNNGFSSLLNNHIENKYSFDLIYFPANISFCRLKYNQFSFSMLDYGILKNEIGNELTTNPIVRKISFTGSTEVGKLLLAQCATTVKKVSMELGGHAPFIVFDDADIDEAVSGAMTTKFRNTGQTCICANRLFIHEKVYDDLGIRALVVLPGAAAASAGGGGCEVSQNVKGSMRGGAGKGGVPPPGNRLKSPEITWN